MKRHPGLCCCGQVFLECVITASFVPSGRAVPGTDGGGELHESAELPRHLPTAGRQAESARRAERTAEVPDGHRARCVSKLAWLQRNQGPITGDQNVTQAVVEGIFSF